MGRQGSDGDQSEGQEGSGGGWCGAERAPEAGQVDTGEDAEARRQQEKRGKKIEARVQTACTASRRLSASSTAFGSALMAKTPSLVTLDFARTADQLPCFWTSRWPVSSISGEFTFMWGNMRLAGRIAKSVGRSPKGAAP